MILYSVNKVSAQIGSIEIQQREKRGWLVGQFFPEESPFQDKNVEVYCKTLRKSEFADKLHYHPHGKEYLLLLEGKIKIQIGDEIVSLKKGDYVAMEANTKDKIIEFSEESVILGVRYPSIPDNKIFLE